MVHASPAVFIHLLSPTNKLGKNLLRLLFSDHTLLPALTWSSGNLDLHNALLAACLFGKYFPAFDTNAVVWSTAQVLTLARSRWKFIGLSADPDAFLVAFAFVSRSPFWVAVTSCPSVLATSVAQWLRL